MINYTDGYKLSHRQQYPANTTKVYSNWTPRKSRLEGVKDVVFFGLNYFIKKYLIEDMNVNFFNKPKEEVVEAYRQRIIGYLGSDLGVEHVEALHDLGYMPLRIKALPEGTTSPLRVAQLTIENTLDEFFWLTNYIETLFSCVMWMPCTSATISKEYNKILTKWATKTDKNNAEMVLWQGHDFSMRGMAGLEAAQLSGAAHALNFTGSDTFPVIDFMKKYYNAKDDELIIGSVAATEHSVMCMGTKEDEIGTFSELMNKFPTGILSVVSDTWDLWKVLTEYLPNLKDDILNRDGKLVIRPDSGDPADILCGDLNYLDFMLREGETGEDLINNPEWIEDILVEELIEEVPHGECGPEEYSRILRINGEYYKATIDHIFWDRHDKQYYYLDRYSGMKYHVEKLELEPKNKGVIELLWDTFGGTVNEQGYKVLNPHIGAIYGDAITLERAEEICSRLEKKGFASTNIVFGIGSYTYQMKTRDTFGYAIKATYGELFNHETGEYEAREIFKDPITDSGEKKSAKGLLKVYEENSVIKMKDQCTKEEAEGGLLQEVFLNGELLVDPTLQEIRERVKKS